MALTSPGMVNRVAEISTANPASLNVADVMGPIEASFIPLSIALFAPANLMKLRTVDELVNVIT